MKIKVSRRPAASNRVPEQWFRRALWLVAVVFASFLIGLGGQIVGDLPQVQETRTLESYITAPEYAQQTAEKARLETEQSRLEQEAEQARLAVEKHQTALNNAEDTFRNWLATRSVVEQSDQNPEVLKRTRELDALKQTELVLQQKADQITQRQLDVSQRIERLQTEIDRAETAAGELKAADDRRTELQVFLYRLALTLPLLLAAGYLFAKKRQSKWWPFVWGFIFFALFAFFVELVPYLPSYGGYVRYLVGIVVTVLAGRYAIIAMNRYIERKQAEEAMPKTERKQQLHYDYAQQCLAKSICPGCERPLDFNTPEMDYCPHCSINLFDYCHACQTRKNAFNRYCFKCGTAAENIHHHQEKQAD